MRSATVSLVGVSFGCDRTLAAVGVVVGNSGENNTVVKMFVRKIIGSIKPLFIVFFYPPPNVAAAKVHTYQARCDQTHNAGVCAIGTPGAEFGLLLSPDVSSRVLSDMM